ncbi:DNA repair protein rad8 [Apiospora marii]|uniref:DNA repair protein rad8 n=1 Tax=Apiospora marii TaxID=335849 RepID=A0ABR1T221_9PEZI
MAPSESAAPARESLAWPNQSTSSPRTASEAGFHGNRPSKRPRRSGPFPGDGASGGRPVTNPLRAFIEMVKKATSKESLEFADLKRIADQGGITFKVATLCSGTESPIFALQLIQQALYSISGLQLFRFEHLLAAEWNPFKQAFASRNSDSGAMFNDIRDLLIGKTEAFTAKGELMTIPRGTNILVAGTSCVDFSNLNSSRQDGFSQNVKEFCRWTGKEQSTPTFDEVVEVIVDITTKSMAKLRESEQTFFSMLAFVAEHKPEIVILENVKKAPFESARDHWFKPLGYTAWVGDLDTKDFYIPQTRQRKYLVAFNDEKFPGADDMCRMLSKAIASLKQPASSNAADYLLGPNDPLAQLARLEMDEKAQKPRTRDKVDWELSIIRHAGVRRNEDLGDERPLTNWVENGRPLFHDRMNKYFMNTLPSRVHDVLDINQLRAFKADFDLLFKTKILDLSQNVDRHLLTAEFRVVGCLTPSGLPYISNQSRFISGYECMAMQGNAMSTTVVGAVLLASLMVTLGQDLRNSPWESFDDIESSGYPNPFISSSPRLSPEDVQLVPVGDFSTTGFAAFSVVNVAKMVTEHRRYCFCNGTAHYSTQRLRECTTCGIIRCVNCAGNPAHGNPIDAHIPGDPIPYRASERAFVQYFPTVIVQLLSPIWNTTLSRFSEQAMRLLGGSYESSSTIIEALANAKFLYQHFHVTEAVTLVYTSDDGFNLKVVCTESGIDWFVMLDPYCSLANNILPDAKKLQHLCKRAQPFMKGTVLQEAVSPLDVKWFIWNFAPAKVEAKISYVQDTTSGSYINLKLVNRWHLNSELFETMDREVTGRYLHAPNCEAAESSLFIRNKQGARGQSVKLFKDPTLSGPPKEDAFVIAYDHRLLASHEHRELLLKFEPKAKLHKLKNSFRGAFEAVIGSRWEDLGD